jgi:uncharacterized protein
VNLSLTLLADAYSVVQYPPGTLLTPPRDAALWNATVTADEVSLVCATKQVPSGAQQQADGWRSFRFEGPFDFALTGILASVAVPLAAANIGIFALSTYNTDYLLVKAVQLDAAVTSLRLAGHIVVMAG